MTIANYDLEYGNPKGVTMNSAASIKRTAVFVFYDKDGIVDDYICFLLQALKPHCTRILCIVNGNLTEQGETKLQALCDDIIRRENEGLDVTAYKSGFRYVMDNTQNEDEILFLNATFFGPVYPFSELFNAMDENKDLDFWGITRYSNNEKVDFDWWGLNGLGYVPVHIQSYFWAVRKNLFASQDFSDYWDNLPEIRTYEEAVSYHEMLFTKHFEDLGYKWDTYIQPTWLNSYSSYPLMCAPVWLLSEQRCPIVKRKSFFSERSENSIPVVGDAGRELYDFLRENTNYDTSLIVKNITRLENSYDYTMVLGRVILFEDSNENKRRHCAVAQIFWVTDETALNCLKSDDFLDDATLMVYYVSGMQMASLYSAFPETAIYKETPNDIRCVLTQARDDAKDFDYIAWVHVSADFVSHEYGNQTTKETDIASLLNALLLAEHIPEAIDYLSRDKNIGAVVPMFSTHRSYYSPNPEWKITEQALQKVFSRDNKFSLSAETLCAGWNAFITTQEIFACYVDLASCYLPDDNDLVSYGYVFSLAVQSLGKLVAFGTNERIVKSEVFTQYVQLHKLADAACRSDMREEGRILIAQSIAHSFFNNFFNPKSFKDRLYFAMMALFSRKAFMRLAKLRGSNSYYPYDIYKPAVIRKQKSK